MRYLTVILLLLTIAATAQQKIMLTKVMASDPDSGQVLTYFIKASSAPEYVGVDTRSGVVYLDSRIFNTFEGTITVSLIVGVKDDGRMFTADGVPFKAEPKETQKYYSFRITKNRTVRTYKT